MKGFPREMYQVSLFALSIINQTIPSRVLLNGLIACVTWVFLKHQRCIRIKNPFRFRFAIPHAH